MAEEQKESFQHAKRVLREVAAGGSDRSSGWCCTVRYDSLGLNANHGSDRIVSALKTGSAEGANSAGRTR